MNKKLAFVEGNYLDPVGSPVIAKLYILLNTDEEGEFFICCIDENDRLLHERSCSEFDLDVGEVLLLAWWEYDIPPSEWNLVLSSENLEERHFNNLKRIVERYQELKEVSVLVKDSGLSEANRLFDRN